MDLYLVCTIRPAVCALIDRILAQDPGELTVAEQRTKQMRQSIKGPATHSRSMHPGSNIGGSQIRTARTKIGLHAQADVYCQRGGYERRDNLENKRRDKPHISVGPCGNEDQPLYEQHKSRSSISRSLEPTNQHLQN